MQKCCHFREGTPVEIIRFEFIPEGSDGAALVYTIRKELYLQVPLCGTTEVTYTNIDPKYVSVISKDEYDRRRSTRGPLTKRTSDVLATDFRL